MDTREELIELLEQKYYCSIEELADYLIANGVTLATDNNVGDKTHADRIRAMSDEELAEGIAGLFEDTRVGIEYSDNAVCWLHWLKLPSE